jgi:hypothetical protein
MNHVNKPEKNIAPIAISNSTTYFRCNLLQGCFGVIFPYQNNSLGIKTVKSIGFGFESVNENSG